MLQLISGKFFKSTERHRFPAKGVIFANYSWVQPVETIVGTLEPVNYSKAVSTYVFSYVNQIEKGGALVRTGDAEILDQFLLLSMFGLRAYFSTDHLDVERACRPQHANSTDVFVPASFIPRVFDLDLRGTYEETCAFRDFVAKVIGLRRETYETVLTCLSNLRNALQILRFNFDAAYSMLVYCLESLAQGNDDYTPTWQDYDPSIRTILDDLAATMPSEIADQMKNALLASSHLKLQARFVNFCFSHTDDSFFDVDGYHYNSFKRSTLRRALQNAYQLRSKYVHKLQSVLEHLKTSRIADGDVFELGGDPFPTMRGLFRLTHHVVSNFIAEQPTLDREDFPWRSALPGVLSMEMAPEYWIWKSDGFTHEAAKERLYGFLCHYQEIFGAPSRPIANLDALMAKIEEILPQAPRASQLPLLVLYKAYNERLSEKYQRPGWQYFCEKHARLLENPSVERFLLDMITGKDPAFPATTLHDVYQKFASKRFQKHSLRLPYFVEMALRGMIANALLAEGETDAFVNMVDLMRRDSGPYASLRSKLDAAKLEKLALDISWIFSGLRSEAPEVNGPEKPVDFQI